MPESISFKLNDKPVQFAGDPERTLLWVLRTDLALTAPVQLLQRYDARIFELPFPLPRLEWHLYWHRSSEQDQASIWLRCQIIELLSAAVSPPASA